MNANLDYRYSPIDVATREAALPSRQLAGYAVRYNVPSDIGPFVEVVAPTAFSPTLDGSGNVRAYVQHNRDRLMATRQAGTLRLLSDSTGLRYEADIPKTVAGDELLTLVERGDIYGVSVGFVIPTAKYDRAVRDGRLVATLVSAQLFEISFVDNPAHQNTSVALRAAFDSFRRGLPADIAARLFATRRP